MMAGRGARMPGRLSDPSARYRGGMGLNPFRSRVERRTDVVVVVAALVVIAALLLWAFFG
jgi:hypothetical protein